MSGKELLTYLQSLTADQLEAPVQIWNDEADDLLTLSEPTHTQDVSGDSITFYVN